MKVFAATVLAIFIFLLIPYRSLPQLSTSDSQFYKTAINNTLALYYQSAGEQSRLYNGWQYPGYAFGFREGHPFFAFDLPDRGSILYDDIFYDSILLQYDEIKDVVVFSDANHRIQLISEKISAFSLWGNHFIRMVKDSLNNNSPNTGFYNQLYKGNISILKKETKNIQEQITNTEGIQRSVLTHTNYYLLKANKYYLLQSKADILEVLKDKKNDIQEYIRANKLKFRRNKDGFFVKVAAYYDSITR